MNDMTMTCGELDLRLADFLDGSLDAATRAAVERHLASCAHCAGVLAALDEQPAAAAALPVLAPSRDLWAGIAARIGSRVFPLGERLAPPVAPRRWRVAQLTAAAVVLVAVTALITRKVTIELAAKRSPVPVVTPIANPNTQLAANATPHEKLIRTYDDEIARLDSAVSLRRNDLDTTTVKIIEKNLRVIDAAIAESRTALAKDPKSRFLNEQLTRVLDQKVGLLRTVALLPTRT